MSESCHPLKSSTRHVICIYKDSDALLQGTDQWEWWSKVAYNSSFPAFRNGWKLFSNGSGFLQPNTDLREEAAPSGSKVCFLFAPYWDVHPKSF